MKLTSTNNSFDFIFEKKNTSEDIKSQELSTEHIFYHNILEKILCFREKFLYQPKIHLLSFFKPNFKFPFLNLSYSFFPSILSIIGLNYFSNRFIMFFTGTITFFSTIIFIGCVVELFQFKNKKQEFVNLIEKTSSIKDLLDIPDSIITKLNDIFMSNIFLTDNKQFQQSLKNFTILKKEELHSFLNSFSKEELLFINDFLLVQFENNEIKSLVLDDLVGFLERQLYNIKVTQDNIFKNNKFKRFLSDYIEQEDINSKTLKSLL